MHYRFTHKRIRNFSNRKHFKRIIFLSRDFDPEETAREKIKKIKEVKGMKGIKILVKEVASVGRHNNDLIGHALIPLKVRVQYVEQTN